MHLKKKKGVNYRICVVYLELMILVLSVSCPHWCQCCPTQCLVCAVWRWWREAEEPWGFTMPPTNHNGEIRSCVNNTQQLLAQRHKEGCFLFIGETK